MGLMDELASSQPEWDGESEIPKADPGYYDSVNRMLIVAVLYFMRYTLYGHGKGFLAVAYVFFSSLSQYGLPLKIVSYKDLYGWTMDEIVKMIGLKNNCTFCGVFRRQVKQCLSEIKILLCYNYRNSFFA